MTIVRVVTEIETDAQGRVSVRSVRVEAADLLPRGVVDTELASSPVDAVAPFVQRLGDNEREALRAITKAKDENRPVYRKEILNALGFDQLLQWNGVSAWITRRWRSVLHERFARITEARYNMARDDYQIVFASDISDDVIERLAVELGLR